MIAGLDFLTYGVHFVILYGTPDILWGPDSRESGEIELTTPQSTDDKPEAIGMQRRTVLRIAFGLTLLGISPAWSQGPDSLSVSALKLRTLEELMDIDITIVSKTALRWFSAPAAVQVITSNQIRRSSATNLPEALRLASNLRVAQLNSYAWVISSRGFSGLFANKLLVMIDGRSVYTPLFAGVFWDAQQVPLFDIDRIEVTSGPGGTLWGANAVNGVINVITKHTSETQGWYVSGLAGSFHQDGASIRYGSSPAENLSLSVHVQRFDRGSTFLATGDRHADQWAVMNGGIRVDWSPDPRRSLTILGGGYFGLEHTNPGNSTIDGQHLLGRWSETYTEGSDLRVQLYVDRTWRRDLPSTVSDQLNTYDLDVQHRFSASESHTILLGAGYRLMQDKTPSSTLIVGFLPKYRVMQLFNTFIQDEISLLPDKLMLTVGTKLEHNDFSEFEWQPGVRIAWTPSARQTIWAAVSRAVRSPSRIDVDYRIPKLDVPPNIPQVAGGPNFDSEKLISYQVGYRLQPSEAVTLSLSVFFHQYDDIYSVEPLPGTVVYQIQNGVEGESRGIEAAFIARPADGWQLRGGYTFFRKNLRNKPGHSSDNSPLGNDPDHQAFLHSRLNVTSSLHMDVTARYVDILPRPFLPAYHTFDVRLAWQEEAWSVSVIGQNLTDRRHPEFGTFEIPRSFFVKFSFSPAP